MVCVCYNINGGMIFLRVLASMEVCLELQESICLRELSAIGRCPLREASLYTCYLFICLASKYFCNYIRMYVCMDMYV